MRRAIYLAVVLFALAVCPAASGRTLSMPQAKRALAIYEHDRFVERQYDSIIPMRWRRQSRRTVHVRVKFLAALALGGGQPFYTTTVLTLQVEHRVIWILDRLPGGGWEQVS